MPHQKFFHLRGFKYWMPLFIFAFSVLVFFFSLNFDMAEAETIYVDASGNGDYTSIQDAINHASEGDTLIVNLGTYTEQLNVDKPLKIFGNSSDASKIVIDGDSTGDTVIFSSSNIIFHNFTLKNSGNDKALISISGNTNSNISNCLFEVNSKGIQFTNSASSHEVYNSTFQGEDKTGTGIEIVDGDNLKIVGSKFTDLNTGIFFNVQGTGVSNQDNTINDCIIKGNRRGIEFFEIEDNENTGTDTTK
ncbi:MAG TPA: hypothetical protein EYP29_03795, partial [Thermoplasmata archaeon]|nr:hypothetical protein [Thermoplasmata archaeon]